MTERVTRGSAPAGPRAATRPDTGSHPVLDLLHTRAAEQSKPGQRSDGHRLALVIEGGGMRGVVSSAMTAVLERRGLTDCFDLVVGTSAGALNGAAFVAGVAQGCRDAYSAAFNGRQFVNPYRLLAGRAVTDVAACLDYASDTLDRQRHERAVRSPIDLHCVAVDVTTAEPVDLTGFDSPADLRGALLASSRIPLIGGPPAEFRGRRWLDGGLAEAIPLHTAIANGATHALVLQTRPKGAGRTSPSPVIDRLIARELGGLNPALVALYAHRADGYEEADDEISRATDRPGPTGPYVYGIRMAAGSPVIGQLERNPATLRSAAAIASEQAKRVLSPTSQLRPANWPKNKCS